MGRDLDDQIIGCICKSLKFSNSEVRVNINEVLALTLKVLIATYPAPGTEEKWLIDKTECPKMTY